MNEDSGNKQSSSVFLMIRCKRATPNYVFLFTTFSLLTSISCVKLPVLHRQADIRTADPFTVVQNDGFAQLTVPFELRTRESNENVTTAVVSDEDETIVSRWVVDKTNQARPRFISFDLTFEFGLLPGSSSLLVAVTTSTGSIYSIQLIFDVIGLAIFDTGNARTGPSQALPAVSRQERKYSLPLTMYTGPQAQPMRISVSEISEFQSVFYGGDSSATKTSTTFSSSSKVFPWSATKCDIGDDLLEEPAEICGVGFKNTNFSALQLRPRSITSSEDQVVEIVWNGIAKSIADQGINLAGNDDIVDPSVSVRVKVVAGPETDSGITNKTRLALGISAAIIFVLSCLCCSYGFFKRHHEEHSSSSSSGHPSFNTNAQSDFITPMQAGDNDLVQQPSSGIISDTSSLSEAMNSSPRSYAPSLGSSFLRNSSLRGISNSSRIDYSNFDSKTAVAEHRVIYDGHAASASAGNGTDQSIPPEVDKHGGHRPADRFELSPLSNGGNRSGLETFTLGEVSDRHADQYSPESPRNTADRRDAIFTPLSTDQSFLIPCSLTSIETTGSSEGPPYLRGGQKPIRTPPKVFSSVKRLAHVSSIEPPNGRGGHKPIVTPTKLFTPVNQPANAPSPPPAPEDALPRDERPITFFKERGNDYMKRHLLVSTPSRILDTRQPFMSSEFRARIGKAGELPDQAPQEISIEQEDAEDEEGQASNRGTLFVNTLGSIGVASMRVNPSDCAAAVDGIHDTSETNPTNLGQAINVLTGSEPIGSDTCSQMARSASSSGFPLADEKQKSSFVRTTQWKPEAPRIPSDPNNPPRIFEAFDKKASLPGIGVGNPEQDNYPDSLHVPKPVKTSPPKSAGLPARHERAVEEPKSGWSALTNRFRHHRSLPTSSEHIAASPNSVSRRKSPHGSTRLAEREEGRRLPVPVERMGAVVSISSPRGSESSGMGWEDDDTFDRSFGLDSIVSESDRQMREEGPRSYPNGDISTADLR